MWDVCISESGREGSTVLEGEGTRAESIIAAEAGTCMDETIGEGGGEIGCAEGWAGEAVARASCADGGKPNSIELLPLNTEAG